MRKHHHCKDHEGRAVHSAERERMSTGRRAGARQKHAKREVVWRRRNHPARPSPASLGRAPRAAGMGTTVPAAASSQKEIGRLWAALPSKSKSSDRANLRSNPTVTATYLRLLHNGSWDGGAGKQRGAQCAFPATAGRSGSPGRARRGDGCRDYTPSCLPPPLRPGRLCAPRRGQSPALPPPPRPSPASTRPTSA
jgi:hypothetical protein